MASCTYNPGLSSAPYAVLNVTQQSQNIANNTSVVRWELLLYRPSAIYSSAAKSFSITVNGSTVRSGTTTIGGSGTKSIASGTTTIGHNADGTKSISFSFSLAFEITWGSTWIGTGSAGGSMSLTRIPRATTPSVPSSVVLGNKITISLPRASSSFTHTLQHAFAVGTWTTFATGATTSASLTFPIDWASRIPNATSGRCNIRCLTYNGSTLIGEKTVSLTGTVPSSVVPSVSSISVIEAVTGIAEKFKAFVKNKSKLSVSVSAAGSYGSTIKSYSAKIDGKSYSGSKFTSELIGKSGSVQVSVTATDSRGRTATKTENINVLDYISPTITAFSVVRGDSNGEPNEEGTFALINLNFSISPVNDLNDNEYKIEYRRHKDTEWTLLGTGNKYDVKDVLNGGNILNADYSYSMRLTLTDFFGSVDTTIDDISSAFTLIDFNKGGRSISFGGVSERDPDTKAIDFKMETFDRFGTRINNGMAKYTGSGERAIDPDSTTDELILTDLNTPTGKFMYIKTVFYIEKSTTTNRAQTAIPYNSNGSMYHRYFSGGVWSAWRRHVNEDEFGDYVVEKGNVVGANTGITYQKWNSGRVDLYGESTISTQGYVIISLPSFVTGFDSVICTAIYMPASTGANYTTMSFSTGLNAANKVTVYGRTEKGALPNVGAKFDWQVVGKWK